MVRGLAKLPVVPVPDIRLQPVDVRDVAERITALALGRPDGSPTSRALRTTS